MQSSAKYFIRLQMCNYDTSPQAKCHNTHREPNKVLCTEFHTTFYATEASKVWNFHSFRHRVAYINWKCYENISFHNSVAKSKTFLAFFVKNVVCNSLINGFLGTRRVFSHSACGLVWKFTRLVPKKPFMQSSAKYFIRRPSVITHIVSLIKYFAPSCIQRFMQQRHRKFEIFTLFDTELHK